METDGKGSHDQTSASIIFLLDVDNTLLDNDALKDYLRQQVKSVVGAEKSARFWDIYEDVRQERDYIDYPETVRRFLEEYSGEVDEAAIHSIFEHPPFASFVYPDAPATLAYLDSIGIPVILSDGDQVFQAKKIRESGLSAAVGGRVVICVHKERELSSVMAAYPANHYVMIDDKARILADLARERPGQFTTIQVLQGHYAQDGPFTPSPDYVLTGIADVKSLSPEQFCKTASGPESVRTRPT